MDFDQALSIFTKQVDYILNNINNLGFSGQKENQIKLEIDSENKDFLLNSNIEISGHTNYLTQKQNLYNQISLQFLDKKEKNVLNLSGYLDYKNIENEKYINLQDFFVDLGSGNYQNKLLLLISKKLENKRILLDLKEKTTTNFYKDFNFLLQTIFASNIFYPLDELTYDGFFAYKIKIQQDILDYISDNTDIKINSFEGLLLVKSNSEVELKIENLELYYKKNYNIKGVIGNKSLYFNIKVPEKEETRYLLSLDFHKNQYKFQIKQTDNYQDMIKLNLNLTNKKLENFSKNTINGHVEISNKLIYGTDLEKNIKINIKAEQQFINDSGFLFQKPESYIMLKQILGDSFSLSQVLSTEDSFINK
ncbi:MAG: hypothetical protein M0P94_00700 [Candidatus Absconditabacterales bacterium]|nr:hypothetical protein [Candidatus Absconditabacterales bacterium]